ncbi:PAS domain S-box protein [Dactylosporangium aurantiacum]|uniref:histidine kinase n=1 Tax=Dactylosporangium aurantiacum TaxID=35754 RepID=A0A9Q9MIJ4_9ACTN|nr:PAS domain S-box protein [Dactylosporangium aurantiacum]MDG6108097.1 PAS domain S-box protein [Dactylosporangium aurantiacum]UWZ53726.1 PAS domain S-box protein [Dactylosporangium aurantiacum]
MPQLDLGVLAQPGRLAALRRAQALLASSSAPVDGLVRLAARSVVAPVGLLTLVDDERMHIVGRHGLPPDLDRVHAEPATSSFCQYVVAENTPVVVSDARDHPALRDLGAVHDRGVTAYLGQPIHDLHGHTLGAICVTDSVPRHWTDDDVAAVGECAAMLEVMLGAETSRQDIAIAATETDAVLETALEAFVGIELTGEITRWNRAAERTFGWSAQEALGKQVDELIIPERFRAAHRAGLTRLARGGVPKLIGQRLQLYAVNRAGDEFPVELTLNVVDGPTGRHAHAFVYDISERVAAERQLARERHFLSALLDNLDAGVVACDERGRLILFNRAMREIAGSDADQSTVDSWVQHYRAYQSEEVASDDLPLVRAFHGEHVREAEVVVHLPGRPRRSFTANAQPIRDSDGNRLGAVAALHEVTDRRRAQRLIECELAVSRILEHAPTIEDAGPELLGAVARTLRWPHAELWLVDKVGNVLRNAAMWTEPGYVIPEPGPLAPGVGVSGVAWETGQPAWIPDISVVGSRLNVPSLARHGLRVGLAVPIRDGGGVTGTLSFFGDAAEEPEQSLIALLSGIAAHVGQFLERRRAEDLARQLARTKDEFISLVGHELRTPLTSISSYTELLLHDNDDETTRAQFLSVIARNAENLRAIIDDLLDLAGLESGYVSLVERPLDFAAVVRASAETGTRAAREKDIDMQVALPDGPAMVAGDQPRLRKVVDHLVTNAVKFTPAGGRVEIELVRDAAGVDLRVADTGVGIPEQERSRLFERFFRGSNIRSLGLPGTGLGLAISRTVIERHGGTITVTDHGDKPGTTFLVRLPSL